MSFALQAEDAAPYFSPYALEKLHESVTGRQNLSEEDDPELKTAFSAYREQVLEFVDRLRDTWATASAVSGFDVDAFRDQCQSRMEHIQQVGADLSSKFGRSSLSSLAISSDLLSLRNIQQSLTAMFALVGSVPQHDLLRPKEVDPRPPLLLGGPFLAWGSFLGDMTGALAGVDVAKNITRERAEGKKLTLHQGGRNPMFPPGVSSARLALVSNDIA